ncbi:MAG: insulinase family protein, partial [Thermomicrobiales bacterium]
YMMMAYRIPEARHPDGPALMVADALLSGAKAMGMGGGGGMGRSSRLYKALVSTGLARSAGSGTSMHIDPHLWTFSATALPGVEPERIEAAFEAELDRLKTDLANDDEFVKARKQIRAQYVYANESVTSQAFWLGQMEIVDHAARVDSLAAEFEAVTPEDVRRVARQYLIPENRVVGWQLPQESVVSAGIDIPNGAHTEIASMAAFEPHRPWFLSGGESSHGFRRTELPNGIIVLAQPRPGFPAVEATVSLKAGQSLTGDQRPGISALTATMLRRGTANRTFEELNEATDGLGAMIGADSGRATVDVSFHGLMEDFRTLLALAAEMIRVPTFPASELELVRQQVLTGIKEQEDDTGAVAGKALRELLYPEGHPYRLPLAGDAESVASFSAADLADYHRRTFGPAVTTVSVVGGIEHIDEATAAIAEVLGDWDTTVPEPMEPPVTEPIAATARDTRIVPGKSQANIAIAYPTIPRGDADYYALSTANLILGQLGLMGRLGAEVRDRNGLAYHVSSSLAGGKLTSTWNARAGVDPANVDRALDGIISELRRLQEAPVSAEELRDAKSYLTGSLPLGLESLGGVVSLLLSIERNDLGLDYLDRYPALIDALAAENLLDAARAHLDADRLAIGVAGPEGLSATSDDDKETR